MKNLLKKIGVIGLAIALIAPFVSVPEVNAEGDVTTKHLHQYLFLDEESLYNDDLFSSVESLTSPHYKADNGYTTTTIFPYSFPTDVKVNITKVTTQPVISAAEVERYLTLHNNVVTNSNPTADYRVADFVAKKGSTDTTTGSNGYNSSTILMHGSWGKYYNLQGEKMEDSKWTTFSENEKAKVIAHSIQNNAAVSSGAQAIVYAGKWNETERKVEKNGSQTFTKDYLQTIVDDVKKADADNLLSSDSNGRTLPITIERKITADVSNAIFGYVPKDSNVLFVFGTLPSGVSESDAKVSDATGSSYANYVKWVGRTEKDKNCKDLGLCFQVKKDKNGNDLSLSATDFREDPKKAAGVDFDVYGTYYWPVIVEVEYETTTNSYGVPDGKWKLAYDANAAGDSSVKGMPESKTYDVKTDGKVDSSIPSRTGYTFEQWCTEGKKVCYKAGDTVPSGKNQELITLYAQWKGTEGTTPQSPTGIASYIISFIAVGAIAGGIYYASKKKNLFKQI